ncbi:MAG: hypothetical protein KDJ52_19850 [Anaerolineae bacterium]|nr:hypothetical protein [Anaerolineae bacterium]
MEIEPYQIVRMLLPYETHPLSEVRQTKLKSCIAEACAMRVEDIHIPKNKKDGLWVCLAVTESIAQRLIAQFAQGDAGLRPLLDEFVVGQLNQLDVNYDQEGLADVYPEHVSLIQLLYPGAESVTLEAVVEHDQHGRMTLLVRFLHGHGRPFVRQIVKIGPTPAMGDKERQTFDKSLPLIAPRLDNVVTWQGLTGLNYEYVGGGMFSVTRTLAAMYQDPKVSPKTIVAVIERMLGSELGYHWYARGKLYVSVFSEVYSRDLIEHLRIRIRSDSADGIWSPHGNPNYIVGYERLVGDTILRTYPQLQPDELVQIQGLTITAIEPGELTLQHPIEPGIVVRVETPWSTNFAVGDRVLVRGQIVYNRRQRMIDIAQQIFAGFSEMKVDVTRARLTCGNLAISCPNPLFFSESVLNQTLRGKRSPVYGAMEAESILVDQNLRGWMIHRETIHERHNLYDFITLESYLRHQLVNPNIHPFSLVEYIHFEENLVRATLDESADVPENLHLQRAYQVILALRRLASQFMSPSADFQGEYFPALLLINLSMLRHHDTLGDDVVRLAFVTAAVTGRYVDDQGGRSHTYLLESRFLKRPPL